MLTTNSDSHDKIISHKLLASRLIEALLKYILTEDNDLLNTIDES